MKKKVLTENRNYFLGDNQIDLNPFEWQYRVNRIYRKFGIFVF